MAVRYNIATDGSDMSLEAFNQVFDNLRRDADHITVTHIRNETKDYLPSNLKSEHIKGEFEARLIGLPAAKQSLRFEPLEDGLSTKEHIGKIVQSDESDVLAIGYHGRKGPKE